MLTAKKIEEIWEGTTEVKLKQLNNTLFSLHELDVKALAEVLTNCTNLTTLDLSSNSIGVDGTKALADALKNCTNLTTLNLSSNNIEAEGTKALAEALKNCTNLTTLDLSSNNIDAAGTKALASALKNCTNLTTLDLSSNYIGVEGAKALAEALKNCTNLTTLDLSSNRIRVAGTKALAEALKNCTNLTTLELSSNRICIEGTKALAEALKNCTNLTTLDLSSNYIGVEGTKALASALKNCTNLTTLDLSSNYIGVEGAKALASALKNCTNLTTLDLSSSSICIECTKALAEALKNCTNLTTLDLSSNRICVEGAKALASALKNCTNLTTLDLCSNYIGVEGAKALAEALKNCTNLTTLDLCSNGIGALGIKALAKMLEKCNNLTTLKLKESGTLFGYCGQYIKTLAEALKSCTNLTTLDLSSNKVDDEGAKALAKGLKRCKNLKILHFDGNNVGFAGASSLAKALHQTCPSVRIWCDLSDTQNSRLGFGFSRFTRKHSLTPEELFAKVCSLGEDINSPDVDSQGLCLFGVATYIFPSGDRGNTNVPDTVSSSQRVAASSGFSFQEIEERVNINFVDTVSASQGPACTFGRRLQSNRRELKSTHAREPASPKSGLQQGANASFSDVMQLAEEIAGFRNSLDKRRESARVALLEEFIGPAVQNYFGQVKLRQISGNMRRCKESLQNLQDQIRESTQVDLSGLIEARDAERELLRELLEDVHPWIREGSDGDGENTVREFKAKLASSIGYFNFGNVSATQNAAADDFKHCQELAARTDKCIQEYKLKLSGEGGTAEQRSKQAVENVIERVSQLGLDNAFRVALRTPEKATELQHELLELRKALRDELKVLKEDAVAAEAEALEILWAINSILCRVENLDGNTTNFEPGSIISREEFDAMYVSLRLGSIKPNLSTIEKIEKALAASRKAMNILKRAKHDLEEEETEDGRVYFRDRIAKQEEILSKGTPIELSKVYRHKLAEILQHAQEHYPELLKDEDWLERLHVSTEGVFEVACSDLWLANVEITDFQPVGEPLASRGGKTVQKVLDDNGNALVIKQFQLEHSGQSEKFYKQVANLGHVISQHVIHIQGAFIDMTPGVPPRGCIVMPFYEQGDLARWIQDYPDEGKTSRDRLATGLLLGVADLHDHGVVHCDIKPENIFLTRNGTPLIGDFDGIKVANRTVTYTSLQATPRYIAPELQDGPVDKFEPAMDMYSVGVVLDDLYPTERSTAMQTLIDSLTATAPGQRPSARQALRHSAFGVAEIPVESCLVCMEEKPLIESTSCEKGDFLCKDCIERAVEAGAKPQAHVIIAADGTMACMKPGCDGKISVQEVARLAPNALNNLLLIVKMKTEIAVATQAEQEIEKRVAELLKADGLARDIKQHLQHIQEKILNICCPNCGTCFVLFDGCCAVACSRDSCNNHFCAWCLEYSSTDSKDCHDHVTKCQKNLAQGRVFPNSFEQVQHAWQLLRAERLRSYWSTNIHDRILRSALLEQLAPLLTSDIVGAGFKLD